ncbi:MAG TPA: VWA domain-containing protein [Gaiellales bacterium]|nr:VWA domain-containing protein [Gaiellales bacterium]
MTDEAGPATPFGVETIHVDLPAVAGAFTRRLHDAGLPVTAARAADLARALALVRPVSRRRLYWTARAVLVSDPAQVAVFDSVFRSVFGGRSVGDAFQPEQPQTAATAPDEHVAPQGSTSPREGAGPDERQGLWSSAPSGGAPDDDDGALDVPLALASAEERLAGKRFDALEPHELAQLFRLMAGLRLSTPPRTTRRYRSGRQGRQIDMRRTLRAARRTGGDPIRLARRQRRVTRRRLVMLCDISGSMEPYARAYLQFLTCAAASGPDAEAFVFATRLTRLTRALASSNPERAIQRAAAAAPDWSSGTRIGDALQAFNDRHGRRGMARGAVVVILSDGWERGDPALVAREMQRLSRLAHRIVWVNPRSGASSFTVQAGGMVAALPFCDALVSGHSFAALHEVVEAIGADSWQAPALVVDSGDREWEDSWASATPVPGSSVAMPSGYGPSRGNTTPGWVTEDQ